MATRKPQPKGKIIAAKMRKLNSMMDEMFQEIFLSVRAEETGLIGRLCKRKHEYLDVAKQILEDGTR